MWPENLSPFGLKGGVVAKGKSCKKSCILTGCPVLWKKN